MRVLSTKSVATLLDLSAKTLRRMVEKGEFPAPSFTLGGGNHRWYEQDVYEWIALQKHRASTPPVKGK